MKDKEKLILYSVESPKNNWCNNCWNRATGKVLCLLTIRLCYDCAKALRECITHNLKELK